MKGDRGRRPTGGVLAALTGLALFIYFVERAGVGEIADGVGRLGWVFVVVVGLGGLRFLVRAAAWMACVDPPHRLTLGEVLRAVVAGDALSNVTPLSIIVGEPAKGAFLRHREPLTRTLPALAVENLFYTLSAILVIAGGLVTTILMFQTQERLWLTTTGVVTAMVGILTAAHLVIWTDRRVGTAVLDWLRRHGVVSRMLERLAPKVARIEAHVYANYPRNAARLVPLAALELCFHVLAIAEIYVILAAVAERTPTLFDAFVLESTNRFISFAFRFVPLRIGVDEAGSGLFADLLAFGTATGVTLAIVRKGRVLVWIAIGIAILVRRGLSVREVAPAAATDVVVAIMARSPTTGAPPKTRLSPVVPDGDDRRRLYAAFLRDTVSACRTLDGVALRVAYTPDGGTTGFAEVGVQEHELMTQDGDDLGMRERALFATLFATGFRTVVIIGSDLPTLPMEHLRLAIDRAAESTVVLGPAQDGGYYLMALTRGPRGPDAVPDLFDGIHWGTTTVLAETTEAAHRTGLRVVLVPSWYDVDDAVGLDRLRADLDGPAGLARAPVTAELLRRLVRRDRAGRSPGAAH